MLTIGDMIKIFVLGKKPQGSSLTQPSADSSPNRDDRFPGFNMILPGDETPVTGKIEDNPSTHYPEEDFDYYDDLIWDHWPDTDCWPIGMDDYDETEEDYDYYLNNQEYLDATQVPHSGGRLEKAEKYNRLKTERIEAKGSNISEKISLSNLPPSWQARGRAVCKGNHQVDSDNKALLAKLRKTKKTNQRRARATIRRFKTSKSTNTDYGLDQYLEDMASW